MDSLYSKSAPPGNVVVRKAKDLDKTVRHWVGSLFGRELADDEQVSVALPSAPAPSAPVAQVAAERAQARRQLLESMDRLGERFKDVSDEQLDAALDEAMKSARPSYEPQR